MEIMKNQFAYNEDEHTLHLIQPADPDVLTIIPFDLTQSPESALEVVRALNRREVTLEAVLSADVLNESRCSHCVVWGGAYFSEDCIR